MSETILVAYDQKLLADAWIDTIIIFGGQRDAAFHEAFGKRYQELWGVQDDEAYQARIRRLSIEEVQDYLEGNAVIVDESDERVHQARGRLE